VVPIAAVRSRLLALLPAAVALLLASGDARADVSSWFALGGGYTGQLAQGTSTAETAGIFTYSVGVGSSPKNAFVVGGVYRGATYFGLGTDIGPSVRVATGSFSRGDWGLALDGGVVWRTWGSYGWWPLQGVLTAGSPWGFQVALGVQGGNLGTGSPAEGMFVALELDLLRLTVTRQGSSERWWPNPNPAGGHQQQQSALLSF